MKRTKKRKKIVSRETIWDLWEKGGECWKCRMTWGKYHKGMNAMLELMGRI